MWLIQNLNPKLWWPGECSVVSNNVQWWCVHVQKAPIWQGGGGVPQRGAQSLHSFSCFWKLVQSSSETSAADPNTAVVLLLITLCWAPHRLSFRCSNTAKHLVLVRFPDCPLPVIYSHLTWVIIMRHCLLWVVLSSGGNLLPKGKWCSVLGLFPSNESIQ